MKLATPVLSFFSACWVLTLPLQNATADTPNDTWTNSIRPMDVDNDGLILSLDAQLIIDDLNAGGARELPELVSAPTYFLDTNADGWVSPVDPLRVINHVAARSNTAVVPEPGSLSLLAVGLSAPGRLAESRTTMAWSGAEANTSRRYSTPPTVYSTGAMPVARSSTRR